MNTIYIVIIFVVVLIIVFILIRKKGKQKDKESVMWDIDLSEPANWTINEKMLVFYINIWREEYGSNELIWSDDLKIFSQGRVKGWIKHKTPIKSLHDWLFGHTSIFSEKFKGYSSIAENAQAGYRKIIRAYKLSSTHTASILNPKWTRIGFTVRKNFLGRNRTCLILGILKQ